MRTLAGLQKPLAGEVFLEDRDLHGLTESERARLLGLVLTERVDVGNLSAYALVALGRYPYTGWDGSLSPADEEVVRWAIDAVGARDLAARSVGELSDGERQKVMIARALAQEPAVLLLDEPTAFLDLPRRVEIVQLLRRLVGDSDRAVLLSTHDLDLALRCADRLWLLPLDGPCNWGTGRLGVERGFSTDVCGRGIRPGHWFFPSGARAGRRDRLGWGRDPCPVDGARVGTGGVSRD